MYCFFIWHLHLNDFDEGFLLGPLEGVGPENSHFFWAQTAAALLVAISGPKKVCFSGPTSSNDPRNWIFLYQNHYVPRHINIRYINSYHLWQK